MADAKMIKIGAEVILTVTCKGVVTKKNEDQIAFLIEQQLNAREPIKMTLRNSHLTVGTRFHFKERLP